MSWLGWLQLGLVVVLGTAGQVALKYALSMTCVHRLRGSASFNWVMLVWLSCYALSTGLWLLALRSIPLSQAFPILGLQYALIPVVSARLLKERMLPVQRGGIALIALGVALVGGS